MIGIAAVWISVLLLTGGFALERVLAGQIVANFDRQLEYVLNAMIAASEIGPDGEVRFTRPPADQRFLEPYSGLYFQVSGDDADVFPSRSLWDRRLKGDGRIDVKLHKRDSSEFAGEPLRLTSLEYRLLHYLMMHQGRVISRTELVEHLYDQDFDRDSNTIEVFIGRVRKKIGADRIETVRGLGYRLTCPDEETGQAAANP